MAGLNLSHNRIEWLDVAKGIVIILMVVGHTGLPRAIGNIIFAFHMPFFFIASGLTTRFDRYPFGRFCWNKLKSLGFPFVIYSLVNLSLWPIAVGGAYSEYMGQFLINGWGGVALWFIPVLFFALIMARIIFFVPNIKARYVLALLVAFISGCLDYFNIYLPWNLAVVPLAAFFILVGDWVKPHIQTISKLSLTKCYLFVIALVLMVAISQRWRMDMAWNQCLPMMPKIVAAICGSYCVVKVSVFTANRLQIVSRIMQAVGRETYIILAFSQVTIYLINVFLQLGVLEKYVLLVLVLMMIATIKRQLSRLYKLFF